MRLTLEGSWAELLDFLHHLQAAEPAGTMNICAPDAMELVSQEIASMRDKREEI